MTLSRLNEFDFFEFHVVVASQDDTFIALARNPDGVEVSRVEGNIQKEVETDIKQVLAPLSSKFVSFESAINLFKRAFPDGFGSSFFEKYEDYDKRTASTFVREALGQEKLKKLLADGDHAAISKLAKQAISKTNVASPFEIMKFGDFLKLPANSEAFAPGLYDLLYGDNFDQSFEAVTKILEKGQAAKWPIITYFPFMANPTKHMLLKPTVTQECALRLGFAFDYNSRPNIETYRSLLGLTDHIRKGIAALEPRDNIDIQSFLYVVGSDGYVAGAESERLKREEGQ